MILRRLNWRVIALAAITSCAAPAYAQDCFPAADAIKNMNGNGYEVTFGGMANGLPVFIAEDGKGGWVLFVVNQDRLCPLMGGDNAAHFKMKPRA